MGQVMEPVVFPDFIDLNDLPKKDWILDGCVGREPRAIFSMLLGQKGELYYHNLHLQEKYEKIAANELRWENANTDDAELIVVAYGTAARIAESAIEEVRQEGLTAGLFRPITLFPYPKEELRELAKDGRKIAVFELSLGQMVEDVVLSIGERAEIYFYGIPGGLIPTPAEIADFLRSAVRGDGKVGRRIDV
jgi:2-oxoglutarate ferredoxin oxidoreductase subunit alpha